MKKIGGCIYTHITQRNNLRAEHKDMVVKAEKIFRTKMGMKMFMQIAVVKIDTKQNAVSFIVSKDWDTSREPEVGDAYMIKLDDSVPDRKKEIKITKGRGQIYHHKWMFVGDDYKGFNVEESKEWSRLWESTLPKGREIKSRIGYRKYWNEILTQYNLNI